MHAINFDYISHTTLLVYWKTATYIKVKILKTCDFYRHWLASSGTIFRTVHLRLPCISGLFGGHHEPVLQAK